ncbi:MAG: hypothetical protein H7Y17_10935 [Chlorobia bacterium]|nr:hypothetical protein [Fimbriimonadaceae bacterium]
MATITNATLNLAHDRTKKIVTATVKCNVNFTALELCQMKSCRESRHFKLKAQLWGEDSGLNFGDDHLWTYSDVFFLPDGTPAATESRTFTVLLGEGVLDEDWGQDEVYGKLLLTNLGSMAQITKKTNTVSHSF